MVLKRKLIGFGGKIPIRSTSGLVKCKTVKEEGVDSKMLEDSVMCRDVRRQDANKPTPVGLVMYRIVQGEGVGS